MRVKYKVHYIITHLHIIHTKSNPQNIHLVRQWLPRLEKKLEAFSDVAHNDYRVFMSAEPANRPENHILPQVFQC